MFYVKNWSISLKFESLTAEWHYLQQMAVRWQSTKPFMEL